MSNLEASNDTLKNYELIENYLDTSEAKDLLLAFSNWFGLQLFDKDFTEFIFEEV